VSSQGGGAVPGELECNPFADLGAQLTVFHPNLLSLERSCLSNAQLEVASSGLELQLIALRDIRPGQVESSLCQPTLIVPCRRRAGESVVQWRRERQLPLPAVRV
jgi:hypothetical protein